MNRKKLTKFLDIITSIIIVPILCFGIVIIYMTVSAKKNNDVPKIGDLSFVKILSESMETEENTTFDKGNIVSIVEVDTNTLEVGDVIAFYEYLKNKNGDTVYSRVIFHRIAEILYDKDGELFFRTKGDNNKAMDAPVHNKYVIGKYTEKFSTLAVGIKFFTSTAGIVVLVLIPASILFFLETMYLLELLDLTNLRYKKIFGYKIKKKQNKLLKRQKISLGGIVKWKVNSK